MRHFVLYILTLLCVAAGAATGSDGQAKRYEFNQPLGSEWEYINAPQTGRYNIGEGRLRLYGATEDLDANGCPTFVGLRPDSAGFSMTTKLFLFDTLDGDEAGLAVYQAPQGYVQCCLNNYRGTHRLKLRLTLRNVRTVLVDKPMGIVNNVWLRMEDDGQNYTFHYSTDGQRYHLLESVDKSLLRPVVVGGGTGIVAGLYAYQGTTKLQAGPSYADFDFLEVSNKE